MKKIDWLRGAAAAASVCLAAGWLRGRGDIFPGGAGIIYAADLHHPPAEERDLCGGRQPCAFSGTVSENPADGRVHFDWSASGFSFTFTGSSVKAVLYTPKTYAVQENRAPACGGIRGRRRGAGDPHFPQPGFYGG